MAILTDDKRTAEIYMLEWDGRNCEDWSDDFFETGGRVLVVRDVGYCIDQAEDFMAYRGDYYDPEGKKRAKRAGIERRLDIEVFPHKCEGPCALEHEEDFDALDDMEDKICAQCPLYSAYLQGLDINKGVQPSLQGII